jgi:hypothetical protein
MKTWGFLVTVIEPSDEQAALKANAEAEGLSLQEWIQQLADVPAEIMATMPKDGASQHDHYIYGWPKREE